MRGLWLFVDLFRLCSIRFFFWLSQLFISMRWQSIASWYCDWMQWPEQNWKFIYAFIYRHIRIVRIVSDGEREWERINMVDELRTIWTKHRYNSAIMIVCEHLTTTHTHTIASDISCIACCTNNINVLSISFAIHTHIHTDRGTLARNWKNRDRCECYSLYTHMYMYTHSEM